MCGAVRIPALPLCLERKNARHKRLQRRPPFVGAPLYAKPYCKYTLQIHHPVDTLLQHLLDNFYLARRPRSYPTPTLTLAPANFGARDELLDFRRLFWWRFKQ